MRKIKIIKYKLNGVTYSHTFAEPIPYDEAEQYVIMKKHVGRSNIWAD